MSRYDLEPVGAQKSFYGKAIVFVNDGTKTLWSYNTPVLEISEDGTPTRLWDGWSATTGKHIKAFCLNESIAVINKSVWDSMPVKC